MVKLNHILRKEARRFIDSVRLSVRGGRGGNGLPKYGGIGGKGGDIYLQASDNYSLLNLKREFPKQRFVGGPGGDSGRFKILGNPGVDTVIKCPPGVSAIADRYAIGSLDVVGDKLLLAKGGCGGGPQNGFIGQKGQALPLTLDLKLLADVGFVGYPNAGKSTLLKALSNAKPKIANYPFTTISPNIGILSYKDFRKISAADLPGLIEGAHMNFGMGHKFLKHCVRTKIILFVVDINGFRLNPDTPHRTAFETIMLLNRELELYNAELLSKPYILAINKLDTPNSMSQFEKLKEALNYCKDNSADFPDELKPSIFINFDSIIPISAMNGINLDVLKHKLRAIIDVYQESKIVKYVGEGTPYEETTSEIIYA